MPGFPFVLVALALAQVDAAPPPAAPAAPEERPDAATGVPRVEKVPASTPTSTATPTATRNAAPTSAATSTPQSTTAPTPLSSPTPRPRLDPAAERAEAERVARAFLAALAAGSADALAAAAAERFSFDGDVVAGRDAVRSTWRARLAGRPGPAPRPGALEVMTAQEAQARHGPPPARIAALARAGSLVAVGDVGGRTVVLFLAREAGRMAVLGMHD